MARDTLPDKLREARGKIRELQAVIEDMKVRFEMESDCRKEMEQKLRESDDRIHFITDNLSNVMIYQLIADDKGGRRFTYVSHAVERLNETTAERVLADANEIYGQVLPDYRAFVKEREEEAAKNLSILHIEVPLRLPSGRVRWFEYISRPRYQADGMLVWDGSEIDITERKQVEEELEKITKEYRDIFEIIPIGLYRTSPEGRFLTANPAAIRNLGYDSLNDLLDSVNDIGKQIYCDPEDRDRAFGLLKKQGFLDNFEARFCRKDGSIVWGSLSARPVYDDSGKFLYILGTSEDISRRKQMEGAMRESQIMLARAQEMGHIGHWQRELPSQKVIWSNEMFRIFGFEPGTCNVDGQFFFDHIHPEDRPNVQKALHDAIAGISLYDVTFRIVRPNGIVRWVHSKGEVIRTREEVPFRVFGTLQDITERREMEDDLRRSRDELELRVKQRTEEVEKAYNSFLSEMKQRVQAEKQLLHAQKMEAIGTLAGGIAHDFNNMLATILGNAELVMDDVMDDSARRNLENIIKACHRSRDLVRQILTFSRKSEMQRGPMHLVPLVKETIRFLRGSLPSTIALKTDFQTVSGPMLGDPAQVQQVIMNLATNAAQAIGNYHGTIRIEVSEREFTSRRRVPCPDMGPGKYLELCVSDSGHGIPAGIIKKVFDPFFTTKEAGQGSGLGLSVVFGIVQSHEGGITVASKKGNGTTFKVFFPLSTGVSEAIEEHVELPRGKEKILVVDDESSFLEMISETLKRLGYTVISASGGNEGWKKFRTDPQHYDLIITDYAMPDVTGKRLAENILNIRPDIPVIICTGYSEALSAEKTKAPGIKQFLTKPIARKELAIVLRQVLDTKNGA